MIVLAEQHLKLCYYDKQMVSCMHPWSSLAKVQARNELVNWRWLSCLKLSQLFCFLSSCGELKAPCEPCDGVSCKGKLCDPNGSSGKLHHHQQQQQQQQPPTNQQQWHQNHHFLLQGNGHAHWWNALLVVHWRDLKSVIRRITHAVQVAEESNSVSGSCGNDENMRTAQGTMTWTGSGGQALEHPSSGCTATNQVCSCPMIHIPSPNKKKKKCVQIAQATLGTSNRQTVMKPCWFRKRSFAAIGRACVVHSCHAVTNHWSKGQFTKKGVGNMGCHELQKARRRHKRICITTLVVWPIEMFRSNLWNFSSVFCEQSSLL